MRADPRRIVWFVAAFVLLCGGTVLFPAIDLAVSRLFYAPGQGFFLADWPPIHLARAAMPWLVAAIALGAVVLMARSWRAGVFLLLALALGPGLLVNTVFKDHWGRARPAQIAEFGGSARFSPAFVPSDACRTNCSFPAGDPAVAFVLVGAGFLVTAPRRRRAVIAGALALGALLGVVRIAQGGHFLSDTLASGFLVVATTWLLHRWIVVRDGLRHPPRHLPRALALLAGAALAWEAAYAWIDRPLALYFATLDPLTDRVFSFITSFGLSTGYLVATVVLALAFAWGSRRAEERAQRQRLALHAWRAAFVFATVAGAGLAGDILKPVLGRARPRLYVSDGIFGFTWHGAHAAYWSAPSGHAITAVSLAAALYVIERRYWPLYAAFAILVMASRVVLDLHYPSDLVAGAAIALAGAWASAAAFRRVLTDSP